MQMSSPHFLSLIYFSQLFVSPLCGICLCISFSFIILPSNFSSLCFPLTIVSSSMFLSLSYTPFFCKSLSCCISFLYLVYSLFISKRLRLPFSYQHYNDSQSQTRQYVLKIDFFILKDSIIFQIEIVSLLFVYLFFFVSLFIGLN